MFISVACCFNVANKISIVAQSIENRLADVKYQQKNSSNFMDTGDLENFEIEIELLSEFGIKLAFCVEQLLLVSFVLIQEYKKHNSTISRDSGFAKQINEVIKGTGLDSKVSLSG